MTWWHFGERIKSLPQAIRIGLGVARKSHVDDRGGYIGVTRPVRDASA